MANEQDPENKGETAPSSAQLPLPHIPEWISQQVAPCSYPGCTKKTQVDDAMTDSETGNKFCQEHAKQCENCSEIHSIEHMAKYKSPRYANPDWYCKDCYYDLFATCPNCQEVVEKEEILSPNRSNRWSMKEGGCTKCSTNCSSCERVIDKDSLYNVEGEDYCEDCYSEKFAVCEECNETVYRDDTRYVENVGEFCEPCYKEKFITCYECSDEVEKDDSFELGGENYCESCYAKKGPTEYAQYTQNFDGFSYTKKDRYLNLLYKILPISVKDLKSKHPSMAGGLSDLIAFAHGKPLTFELVQQYRDTMSPENFPVEYTVWDGMQRSIDKLDPENRPTSKPQLVINIIASPQMLNKMKSNPSLYDLFDKVNKLSKESTHPYVGDQIGWARIEIDPAGQYLLVDEVQNDHSNAGFRLKHEQNNQDINQIRNALRRKYQLDDDGLDALLKEYSSIMKDFPNIASQAIINFARQNKINKIFWHTYESNKKLKDNAPPKSIYDKTPKENFFLPSSNKPFGLEGEFLEREAQKSNKLYKFALSLYLKHSLNFK